jgi:hypothetical protein
MSEEKNEGLEVVGYQYSRTTESGRNVRLIRITKKRSEGWAIERLCLHSEALAALATRDARIAELEDALHTAHNRVARYADERDQLRAELDRSRVCLSRVDAENSALNAELAANRERGVAAIEGWTLMPSGSKSMRISCGGVGISFNDDEPDRRIVWLVDFLRALYAAPAPAVVMPERMTVEVAEVVAWMNDEDSEDIEYDSIPLMTVAQHNRIVSDLVPAVVMPERMTIEIARAISRTESVNRAGAEYACSWYNRALDKVARLNPVQGTEPIKSLSEICAEIEAAHQAAEVKL